MKRIIAQPVLCDECGRLPWTCLTLTADGLMLHQCFGCWCCLVPRIATVTLPVFHDLPAVSK
jgi:hypothetical protein